MGKAVAGIHRAHPDSQLETANHLSEVSARNRSHDGYGGASNYKKELPEITAEDHVAYQRTRLTALTLSKTLTCSLRSRSQSGELERMKDGALS